MNAIRLTALVLALAALTAAFQFAGKSTDEPRPLVSSIQTLSTPLAPAASDTTAPQQTMVATDTSAVLARYRMLLKRTHEASHDRLIALLYARDAAGSTHESSILDQQIAALLGDEDFALYERLRDADVEQRQLALFAAGLIESDPLTPEQFDALLLAKMSYQPEVALLINQHPRAEDDLPEMERTYLHDFVTDGLDRYSHAFLEDARAVLTEEQWFVLAQHEAEHVQRQLAALKPSN